MTAVDPILRDLTRSDCTQQAPWAVPFDPQPALAAEPAPERPRVLSLQGVSKVFEGRGGGASAAGLAAVRALDGVDLAVPQGDILGVIGRSGAGKSTLIRLANGLERPTAGRVVVDGVDTTGFGEPQWRGLRRRIGMIFQHFNLLSSRTVADNVALPLEVVGERPAAIGRRVAELLDLVGLADKRDRYPAELSGGQKQRVGIARALATEPRLLLCDEATSALDPETTQSILALLREVNRSLGVTILLITHEIPVIAQICDQVAVLDGGRIVESGRVFDVFTSPAHATTARFVESVTGVSLPADVAARLTADPAGTRQAILRIGFRGPAATTPVLSRLASIVGVEVNILAGRIDAIAGQPYGALVVAVPHAQGELPAVLAALRLLSLETRVLGYVA